MANQRQYAENLSVTPKDVRVHLQNTDWAEYNRKVVARVAEKAEGYRRANVKSREEAARLVFV